MRNYLNTNTYNKIRYTIAGFVYDPIVKILNKFRKESIELVNLKESEKVLIVGVGTGLDFEFLPQYLSGPQYTGIDLTQNMLKKAKKKAEKLKLKIDLIQMDAQKMDFPDKSYDVIILHLILAVVPDAFTCIREVRRVLKDDGRIIIFDKFFPDQYVPNIVFNTLNFMTNIFATEIIRQLGPILELGEFEIISEKKYLPTGFFKIVLAKKTQNH